MESPVASPHIDTRHATMMARRTTKRGPSPFPLVARRTAATVCARLFAAHP
jgi:hypothetical protein